MVQESSAGKLMKPLKICMFTPIFPPDVSGIGNSIFHKNKWLKGKGHDTKIFTFAPRNNQTVEQKFQSGEILRFQPFFRPPQRNKAFVLKDMREIAAAIIRECKNFDILEIHGYSLFNYCVHFAKRFLKNARIIQVYRGNDGWLYNEKKLVNLRKWQNKYAYTLCNSHALKKFIEAKNIRVDTVIWNATDPELFYAEENAEEENTYITVKDLYPSSGIDMVLDALSIVKHSVDFHYLVAGEGPARKHFEEKCRQSGIRDNVTLLGDVPHENIRHFLNKAAVKILTSEKETCPHVILESMMCAKPVIITPVGDAGDIIKRCGGGVIVDFHDTKGLAEAILKLSKDKPLRMKMGKNARDFAVKNLSTDVIFSQYLALYHELIAGKI